MGEGLNRGDESNPKKNPSHLEFISLRLDQ